ncbi:hypothetical protein ONS95_012617 [Cadophora gregata]|uniref:uncharacterized protein n=1 Tax=Cadophora gregata TaxID=51156 RepID=UPI0026DB8DD0|nr:uncharacterized protein ONS95_012617 [Cadophora gregata]KAK0118324.1 hypothetical protein ONS95_012617 [Cadophora gregata]KAK0123392.1 hypothetical protein ONS96_010382 [Cadophora gregata f. sp. sojae]
MLSFLRATPPPRTNTASHNPITYEGGIASVEFHAPNSKYIMTHQLPPNASGKEPSILQPPFHLHIYQIEYFNLRSGTGNFYLGLDPKPFVTVSEEPDAPKTVTIPAGRYHRFENASETEKLVLDIHLTPEAYENEQKFFRNFFGYLDDCKKSKTAPSLFQLLVFLHSADTPLAIPLPNERLGVIVSRIFLIVVAFWGKFMLGYKDSYPEYYEEGKSK